MATVGSSRVDLPFSSEFLPFGWSKGKNQGEREMERLLLNLLVSDNTTIQEVCISRYSSFCLLLNRTACCEHVLSIRSVSPGRTTRHSRDLTDSQTSLGLRRQSDLQFVFCLLFCSSIIVIRCSVRQQSCNFLEMALQYQFSISGN